MLVFIRPHVKAGVTTGELDRLCHDYIVEHDAYPAPLNYKGFPKSICTSVNEVCCHGIPGNRKLFDGDIINIDVATIVDGWFGDTSEMFTIGEIRPNARKLIDATRQAMWIGISEVAPGKTIGDIGAAIYEFARPPRVRRGRAILRARHRSRDAHVSPGAARRRAWNGCAPAAGA